MSNNQWELYKFEITTESLILIYICVLDFTFEMTRSKTFHEKLNSFEMLIRVNRIRSVSSFFSMCNSTRANYTLCIIRSRQNLHSVGHFLREHIQLLRTFPRGWLLHYILHNIDQRRTIILDYPEKGMKKKCSRRRSSCPLQRKISNIHIWPVCLFLCHLKLMYANLGRTLYPCE